MLPLSNEAHAAGVPQPHRWEQLDSEVGEFSDPLGAGLGLGWLGGHAADGSVTSAAAPACATSSRRSARRHICNRRVAQLEYRHRLDELKRLKLQALGRGGALFHKRGVLLCYVIHLGHGVADL